MNKDQLKQAAEVMRRAAEGEVVITKTGNTEGWIVVNPVWDWCKNDYRILDFPSPPEGQKWHNPANLNATQVGVRDGWRLLLESEVGEDQWKGGIEYMENSPTKRWSPFPEKLKYYFSYRTMVYRTKSPLPEVKADPYKAAWEATFDPRMYPHCDMFEAWFRKGWDACKEHYKIP